MINTRIRIFVVSDIHGIVAVEAAGAQIQAAAVTGLFDAFNTDIAQTVCTNKFGSFFNAHFIGDQFDSSSISVPK